MVLIGLIFSLIYGVAYGLVYGLISTIALVLSVLLTIVYFPERTTRNGGLLLSLVLVVGLLVRPIYRLVFGLPFGLVGGLSVVLASVLIAGLIVSGLSGIFLLVLIRLLLWHAGYIPLNYRRFLDHAPERIFLRKVGGSYIFVHRLLLDYFATLDETASTESTSLKNKV